MSLYGTTGGGDHSGTVFKLDTTGAETVLHRARAARGPSKFKIKPKLVLTSEYWEHFAVSLQNPVYSVRG